MIADDIYIYTPHNFRDTQMIYIFQAELMPDNSPCITVLGDGSRHFNGVRGTIVKVFLENTYPSFEAGDKLSFEHSKTQHIVDSNYSHFLPRYLNLPIV